LCSYCNIYLWLYKYATPTAEITGSYTSGLKYENYPCNRLDAETNSLARRENQLIAAQRQRIKTSETQAFWFGYGKGDGLEASELASNRQELFRLKEENRQLGNELDFYP